MRLTSDRRMPRGRRLSGTRKIRRPNWQGWTTETLVALVSRRGMGDAMGVCRAKAGWREDHERDKPPLIGVAVAPLLHLQDLFG